MIKRLYKKYAKDLTIIKCISEDKNILPKFNKEKLKKYFLRALSDYCKLRLKLLQNKNIEKIEQEILKAAVKAGIKYAVKEFNVDIDISKINEVVDRYLPEISKKIHQDRTDLFVTVINYANRKLE